MTDLIAELAEVPVVAYAWRKEGMKGWALGHSPPTPNMADFGKYEVRELTFRTHHAEIEAMARKARRYDWLNAHRLDFIARNNMHEPRVYLPVGTDLFQPDAMDNTIDKAMRDSAREGGNE